MMLNSGVLDGVHEAAVGAQRGGSNHHHHHHHHQRGLKKGPWTAAEDAILIEYVKKHGEGNWNGVQKNSGLARCGKSCRLRWANHLRPNLKKGSLSPEEEKLIMELHAKFGNKWARMASQLPGRTDNEIKNYWNTRMKRRQRAGLPVYPHDLQQEAPAATFQHHHQLRHSSSSSASSFSSLLSSSQPREPNNFSPSQLSLYDHITSTFSSTSDHQNPTNNYFLQNNHHISSSLYSNPITQFHGNGGFAMPLSPVSPFGSSSSSALFNQSNIPNQAFIGQYNTHGGFRGYNNLSLSSMMIMGPPTYDPIPLVQGSNPELPSNQTLLSINGLGEDQMGGSGYTASEYHYEIAPVPPQGNSGLLDDVLVEAQNKSNKKAKSGDSCSSGWSSKEKGLMVEEEEEQREESAEEEAVDTVQVESKSSGENSADNQRDGSSSPSAIGMKQNEDPLEEMDDDLFSLLNFPSAPAVSESWYVQGCMSNRASMSGVVTSDNVSLEIQQNAPLTPSVKTNTAAASEVKRSLGSCYWNNMPGIC